MDVADWSWLRSDDEAAKHPWKVRAFKVVFFAVVVFLMAVVGGVGLRGHLLAAFSICAIAGIVVTALDETSSRWRLQMARNPVKLAGAALLALLIVAIPLAYVFASAAPVTFVVLVGFLVLPVIGLLSRHR